MLWFLLLLSDCFFELQKVWEKEMLMKDGLKFTNFYSRT